MSCRRGAPGGRSLCCAEAEISRRLWSISQRRADRRWIRYGSSSRHATATTRHASLASRCVGPTLLLPIHDSCCCCFSPRLVDEPTSLAVSESQGETQGQGPSRTVLFGLPQLAKDGIPVEGRSQPAREAVLGQDHRRVVPLAGAYPPAHLFVFRFCCS